MADASHGSCDARQLRVGSSPTPRATDLEVPAALSSVTALMAELRSRDIQVSDEGDALRLNARPGATPELR